MMDDRHISVAYTGRRYRSSLSARGKSLLASIGCKVASRRRAASTIALRQKPASIAPTALRLGTPGRPTVLRGRGDFSLDFGPTCLPQAGLSACGAQAGEYFHHGLISEDSSISRACWHTPTGSWMKTRDSSISSSTTTATTSSTGAPSCQAPRRDPPDDAGSHPDSGHSRRLGLRSRDHGGARVTARATER